MDAERKAELRAAACTPWMLEVLDALDAAEARAEEAEAESDALQGDIDSMSERWHDAVAAIHVALGGDGEWKAHAGKQPPIEESGHLHLASKAMAESLVAERDRLREALEDVEWTENDLNTPTCNNCGFTQKEGHARHCEIGSALGRPECQGGGDA